MLLTTAILPASWLRLITPLRLGASFGLLITAPILPALRLCLIIRGRLATSVRLSIAAPVLRAPWLGLIARGAPDFLGTLAPPVRVALRRAILPAAPITLISPLIGPALPCGEAIGRRTLQLRAAILPALSSCAVVRVR